VPFRAAGDSRRGAEALLRGVTGTVARKGAPMPNLPLSFACGLYDRMLPLYTREVVPEGIDLSFTPIDTPAEVFGRMIAGELDVSEMSSSGFIRQMSTGKSPFVGIPVFPSRVFRHGMICVRRDAGISGPKGLEGRRVGLPVYSMTAAVWIRGLLQHEYGVDLSTIVWVEETEHVGGGSASVAVDPNLRIERDPSGKALSALLSEGRIDAFIGADIPEEMRVDPRARRLFPDYREAEKAYYLRTHIFPIMHVIVIRRAIYEQHPFVAASLYDAFNRAKASAIEKMRYTGTLRYMLPWMIAEIEENDEIFGGDPFVYGIEPNRPTLNALIGYLGDQSLLAGPVDVDSLFVPVTS
jgi:4,5-dihydroxyphthalate decarboxylase